MNQIADITNVKFHQIKRGNKYFISEVKKINKIKELRFINEKYL